MQQLVRELLAFEIVAFFLGHPVEWLDRISGRPKTCFAMGLFGHHLVWQPATR